MEIRMLGPLQVRRSDGTEVTDSEWHSTDVAQRVVRMRPLSENEVRELAARIRQGEPAARLAGSESSFGEPHALGDGLGISVSDPKAGMDRELLTVVG